MVEGSNGITTWQAVKALAIPGAAFLSVASGLLWFAGEAWIRQIAASEIQSHANLTTQHQQTITEHAGLLQQHDEEIEDNEESIEKVDDKFTEFMREVIDRL